MDILRFPKLRIKTLIMFFNWFSSSFMLYGIALNWQGLTGGLFINFLIAAILDFPGKLLALMSLTWMGRRFPYIGLSFLAGLFFIINLFVPRGVYEGELPVVVLSMISRQPNHHPSSSCSSTSYFSFSFYYFPTFSSSSCLSSSSCSPASVSPPPSRCCGCGRPS